MNKPPASTIYPWLKANLGKKCLAPLTSTDGRALLAAVQIVDLWAFTESADIAKAFGIVVSQMQRETRHLAFHAIAHIANWDTRYELWQKAGLELPANLTLCAWEPGGSARP